MLIDKLKASFQAQRQARQRAAMDRHAEALEKLRLLRFPQAESERFALLWCEIAEICAQRPDELDVDSALTSLRGAPGFWTDLDNPLEDLNYLMLIESGARPPPRPKPTTIGEVVTYLLTTERTDSY